MPHPHFGTEEKPWPQSQAAKALAELGGCETPSSPGHSAAGQAPKPWQGLHCSMWWQTASVLAEKQPAVPALEWTINGKGEREWMARVALLICWLKQLPTYQKQILIIFWGQSVLRWQSRKPAEEIIDITLKKWFFNEVTMRWLIFK